MLEQAVQYLKGVGPHRAKALQKLEILTVKDLLYHFPRDYQDRSQVKKIASLLSGQIETISAQVIGKQERQIRSGMKISKLVVSDGFSSAYVVWFNQPYWLKKFSVGQKILICGKVEKKVGEIQFLHAEVETDENEEKAPFLPIYPSTEGLNQKIWRAMIKNALESSSSAWREILPADLIKKYKLLSLSDSLQNIHFPSNWKMKEQARRRLAFEELFLFQLALAYKRRGKEKKEKGIIHQVNGSLVKSFLTSLPFTLTTAQARVIEEIKKDLTLERPMNRLVQGDVGAGKTIVAAAALACALQGGYQGAMMAPTEILAEQHFQNLKKLFTPLDKKVAILKGSLPKKEKKQMIESIANGQIDIVVGTHALLQEEVAFAKLGLAITDEQHRFGVLQRAILQKKGINPDVLIMTATPIPRTLSLTIYGDLDISIIDQLPPGRQPVKTWWAPSSKRDKVYEFLIEKLRAGRQVYFVCPLVEESEKLDLQAATELADKLQKEIFPDYQVGLLHGKMKAKEKDSIMQLFREQSLQILVSTTVIEVGVDIPNATIMVIENCERFGLAQLHQLRGRVGRGSEQSFCILLTDSETKESKKRIAVMTRTNDGFEIAEEDLQLRGPGEFLGLKQHGFPIFKLANLLADSKMMETARKEAWTMLEKKSLDKYPFLKAELEKKFASLNFFCN